LSTETTGPVSVTVVQQAQPQSFLTEKINLTKLQSKLNKAAEKALDTLISIMEETEDEALKARCARDIIGMGIDVTKEINQDQFQRLLAEIKFSRPTTKTLAVETEESKVNRPTVDFTTIRTLD
jgi:hypothetical protein